MDVETIVQHGVKGHSKRERRKRAHICIRLRASIYVYTIYICMCVCKCYTCVFKLNMCLKASSTFAIYFLVVRTLLLYLSVCFQPSTWPLHSRFSTLNRTARTFRNSHKCLPQHYSISLTRTHLHPH